MSGHISGTYLTHHSWSIPPEDTNDKGNFKWLGDMGANEAACPMQGS
jgi:hypothetical protein